MVVTKLDNRRWLFIHQDTACRYLLKDTKWKDQVISQIIARLPGAEKGRHRISGAQKWGVRIPWEYVQESFLGDSDTPDDTNGRIGTGWLQRGHRGSGFRAQHQDTSKLFDMSEDADPWE